VLSIVLFIAILFAFFTKISIALQASALTILNITILTTTHTIVLNKKKKLLCKQKTILSKQFKAKDFFFNSKKLQNK